MAEVHQKWDPDCAPLYPIIPPLTQEYMKENEFLFKKECMINVEWKSVVIFNNFFLYF